MEAEIVRFLNSFAVGFPRVYPIVFRDLPAFLLFLSAVKVSSSNQNWQGNSSLYASGDADNAEAKHSKRSIQ